MKLKYNVTVALNWDTVLGWSGIVDDERHTLTLTCEKHVKAAVDRHIKDKPIFKYATPCEANVLRCHTDPGEELDDDAASVARSVKGDLVYLAEMIAEIKLPVSIVCRRMHKPTVLSAAAADRILMWCARNPAAARNVFDCSQGIVESNGSNPADVMYGGAPKDLGVHGIVDAEHGLPASFDVDKDYSAGFAQGARAIMFLGGYIHLVSHRIGAVTKDVTAAEVWEAAACAADVAVYVATLNEWGIPIAYTVKIWSDSESTKWIAEDARAVKRIAYVARRCRYLQELEARGVIKIMKILGTKNPVNALTKATITFNEFLSSLNYITGGATAMLHLK